MRRTRITTALLALALPLVACGADDTPVQGFGLQPAAQSEATVANEPTIAPTTSAPESVPEQPAAITADTAPPTTEPTRTTVATIPPAPRPTVVVTVPEPERVSTAVSGACGGSLPPCWVMQRESGGDPRIWNGGCYDGPCPGGSTASGKWQFLRSTWDGYGGYIDAADAPVSVQDSKARLTWDGGDGCSHWAACG